jgi:hypothetical protein
MKALELQIIQRCPVVEDHVTKKVGIEMPTGRQHTPPKFLFTRLTRVCTEEMKRYSPYIGLS